MLVGERRRSYSADMAFTPIKRTADTTSLQGRMGRGRVNAA